MYQEVIKVGSKRIKKDEENVGRTDALPISTTATEYEQDIAQGPAEPGNSGDNHRQLGQRHTQGPLTETALFTRLQSEKPDTD